MNARKVIFSTEIAGFLILILTLGVLGFNSDPSVRVFMIGDSTMANKPDPENNPERGWGQMLHKYFKPSVSVHNHAVNGRSTRSFIDEGRWKKVLDSLSPGDYVVIQFAHNDQKEYDPKRYTNPYTAYRNNLVKFVTESRSKGAIPILVTPVVRRKFNEDGVLKDTHGVYPFVMRDVAQDLDVAFVDLQSRSEELIFSLGDEPSKELYMWIEPGEYRMFPDGKEDDTHFREQGASAMAKLFVEGLANTDLDELSARVQLTD